MTDHPADILERLQPSGVGSALFVDVAALRDNARRVRDYLGPRFFWAVVKADGYGAGAIASARAFLAGGADGLAVARVEEAMALRAAGFTAPVLILGPLPRRLPDLPDLHLSVSTPDELRRAATLTQPLHVKVDTGMGRLGLSDADSSWHADVAALGGCVAGLWSHYSHADCLNHAKNHEQRARFFEVVARLAALGVRPAQVHLANSGGLATLSPQETAARIGLFLYGVNPWHPDAGPLTPRPAISWWSRLCSPRRLPAGAGISYRSLYTLPREASVAVVPTGYADGLPALPSRQLTLGGRGRYDVRGRITMDMAVVETDAEAREGEPVCWFGDAATGAPSVEVFAAACGRIPYEALTAVSARVPRVVVP